MAEEKTIFSVRKNADFEKLFKEYFVALSHYAFKFVKDVDSSKEIVHKVFISLWEKRFEIHENTPLRSYLFTAVRNRCLNHLRDNRKFESEELTGAREIQDPAADPSEMEDSELETRIMKEIDQLPERCSEIFRMARFENKKYKEIAESLGISVKTVEAQMSKALRILRDKLSSFIALLILWIIIFFYNFQ